jgi:hypothetical protein
MYRGLFVRKSLVFLISFCLNTPLLFATDSDTTYGRIRIKNRTTSSNGNESKSSNDENIFGSCMESCVSGAFDGCLDALFNNSGENTVRYNGDQSDNDQSRKKRTTFAKEVEPCGYSSSPFHYSGGVAMGGVVYSKAIAAGFVLGGTTGFTWFPDTFFGVRLTAEPMAALDDILVDMEKDVFVDGSKVGTTVFSGKSANEFILPLMGQVLFVPPVPSRSMYLSFGGGACYKRETTWGKQTFSGNVTDRKINFNQWCPAFHLGFGFFLPLNEIYGILEFSYTIVSNENNHQFETPGDNARYGHMPFVSFSISTP